MATSSCAAAWRASSSINVSPALTEAPSATSTVLTVASKWVRSATDAIAWAVPISSIRHGTSLRAARLTRTDTGGRGAAAGVAAAVAPAGSPVSARGSASWICRAKGAAEGQNFSTLDGA